MARKWESSSLLSSFIFQFPGRRALADTHMRVSVPLFSLVERFGLSIKWISRTSSTLCILSSCKDTYRMNTFSAYTLILSFSMIVNVPLLHHQQFLFQRMGQSRQLHFLLSPRALPSCHDHLNLSLQRKSYETYNASLMAWCILILHERHCSLNCVISLITFHWRKLSLRNT